MAGLCLWRLWCVPTRLLFSLPYNSTVRLLVLSLEHQEPESITCTAGLCCVLDLKRGEEDIQVPHSVVFQHALCMVRSQRAVDKAGWTLFNLIFLKNLWQIWITTIKLCENYQDEHYNPHSVLLPMRLLQSYWILRIWSSGQSCTLKPENFNLNLSTVIPWLFGNWQISISHSTSISG